MQFLTHLEASELIAEREWHNARCLKPHDGDDLRVARDGKQKLVWQHPWWPPHFKLLAETYASSTSRNHVSTRRDRDGDGGCVVDVANNVRHVYWLRVCH